MALAAGGFAQQAPIDYSRDIRPILSDNCFKCHGPDNDARQAELRLDTPDGLFAEREGRRAVAPGKPEQSEALRRILSHDESEHMPPPEANRKLSANQIELLRRWIEQGAVWKGHWAFESPRRSQPPKVAQRNWAKNAIDMFVLSRLEREGLAPAPEADRIALIRRVSLDLIGLPPSPEEADAFAQDDSPDAYERLVDRLLASPQYGERWGRKWLDLARYADTNGYEKDRPRSIWPYRDWVIDTLNADMPFDRFTVEQIAGDMLPGASRSQRIATGFHRNTMLNEEGGIDPLEFRFHAMTDRAATTGAVWLGLTIGCAQCHTHKFDPITHRDYYSLMAFLNNADEPDLELASVAEDTQYHADLRRAEKLLTELPKSWPADKDLDASFSAWLADQRKAAACWKAIRPTSMKSNLPLLTLQADGSVFASGDTTKHDVYELVFSEVSNVAAIRLEALPDERLPARGPGLTYYEGTKGDFFLGEFQLTADGQPVKIARASHSYARNRFGAKEVSAERAVDGDLQTGWSVDGRLGERHVAVFVLESPLVRVGELKLKMDFGRHFASSLGRFRISIAGESQGVEASDIPEEIERLLLFEDDRLTHEQRLQLRNEFLLQAPEVSEQAKQIRKLRERPEPLTTLVMQERPLENPRPTFLHHRGEFLQSKDRAEPGTLEALHPFPTDLPRNRLGLAKWLVAPENPLTARVTVNRHWAAFFGRGLVSTLDDFGMQGQPPSHPELLDWLAVDFMESGWSIKELHRKIVTSAAYRQSSRVTKETLSHDPDNHLLSRSPRLRLDAEVLRDTILSVSGLLSLKSGGPPVRPPQPGGVTEAAYGSPAWNASEGEDRYRRSVYTFLKRTAPFAMFNTFDAPSGEACVARRDVSNTSLQALTLLNDPMIVEAAQAFGSRLAFAPGDDAARVRLAFRLALTRPPTDDEAAALVRFLQMQRERLTHGELDAQAIGGGRSKDANDQAVWTSVARALFSLDEMIARN